MLVFTNPGTPFANGVELHNFIDILGISQEEAIEYIKRNPDTITMVDEDAEYFAALEIKLQEEFEQECEQYDKDFDSYYGIENGNEHFFMDMPEEQFELFPGYDLPF